MAKKEKISILREEQFEEVEEALSDAMANLDAANGRIAALLNSEDHEIPQDYVGETTETIPENSGTMSNDGRLGATVDSDSSVDSSTDSNISSKTN